MLSADWCQIHNLFFDRDNEILYSDAEPSDQTQKEVLMLLGVIPEIRIISTDELKKKFSAWDKSEFKGTFNWVKSKDKKPSDDKIEKTFTKDTIELVDNLISNAIYSGASDIHIEPYNGKTIVRYRLFGNLQIVDNLNPSLHRSVIARLKIMSGLDIAETRRPMDGNIRVSNSQRQVDIRLSTMPTRFGEKAVMRLLDKDRLKLDLDQLGFTDNQLPVIRQALKHKNGMIICTGPTGSGKTTTLYSMLTELNHPEVNILTIEDPIEYELEGINQSQVNTAINLTFASALRAFLRQDPDIIMVGEIRDEETTEIALRAAMTGHLVLTTLHTNTPEGARQRLIDLGGSPFIIDDTLRLIIGQALIPINKENNIVGRKIKARLVETDNHKVE